MPVLMYGSEIMIWMEKERSSIRVFTDGKPQIFGGYQENG